MRSTVRGVRDVASHIKGSLIAGQTSENNAWDKICASTTKMQEYQSEITTKVSQGLLHIKQDEVGPVANRPSTD